MFAVVSLPFYAIITIWPIFLFAGRLQERVSIWLSAAIPSGAWSLILSAWIFVPEIDDFIHLFFLWSWLFIPWFLASLVGLRLWPRDHAINMNGDIND